MHRAIVGFHLDEADVWVAELSCLHNQHVRHRPPLQLREWVTSEKGRADRLGTELDCPWCDHAELPDGLVLARVAGPWSADEIPRALLADHRVAERTWGVLRVVDGTVAITIATEPPIERQVSAGDTQPIPPTVRHRVTPGRDASMAVDFYVRPEPRR